jgi:hypothetical protein
MYHSILCIIVFYTVHVCMYTCISWYVCIIVFYAVYVCVYVCMYMCMYHSIQCRMLAFHGNLNSRLLLEESLNGGHVL